MSDKVIAKLKLYNV